MFSIIVCLMLFFFFDGHRHFLYFVVPVCTCIVGGTLGATSMLQSGVCGIDVHVLNVLTVPIDGYTMIIDTYD